MNQDQEALTRALLVVIDKVERMHAKAEEAMYTTIAVREALARLAVELKARDPQLATVFQDFSNRLASVARSGHGDPELGKIRINFLNFFPSDFISKESPQRIVNWVVVRCVFEWRR